MSIWAKIADLDRAEPPTVAELPDPCGDNQLARPNEAVRTLERGQSRQSDVSELARELGIGRPLLHMHLQTLERAGLVVGRHEISDDGKALRYYEVADFDEQLTPERVREAMKTLSSDGEPTAKVRRP